MEVFTRALSRKAIAVQLLEDGLVKGWGSSAQIISRSRLTHRRKAGTVCNGAPQSFAKWVVVPQMNMGSDDDVGIVPTTTT